MEVRKSDLALGASTGTFHEGDCFLPEMLKRTPALYRRRNLVISFQLGQTFIEI
jgi:hypothetical protein